MTYASKTIFCRNNLTILRPKVTKNLKEFSFELLRIPTLGFNVQFQFVFTDSILSEAGFSARQIFFSSANGHLDEESLAQKKKNVCIGLKLKKLSLFEENGMDEYICFK